MSIPLVPNRLVDGGNLDVERINDDLRSISSDLSKSIARRYTYSRFFVDLSGMANTDTLVARQIPIATVTGTSPSFGEVIAVELVLCAADTAVWTMSLVGGGQNWPSFTVTDSGSASTEATNGSSVPVKFDATGVTFQLDASGASTLSAQSYAVFHVRFDRFADDATGAAGWVPTPISATTSTAASTINNALTAAAAAVTLDTNDANDIRVECYVVRNLASGSTTSWQSPSGQRARFSRAMWNVQTSGAGKKATFTVDGASFTVNGAGATSVAHGEGTLSGSETDDPMTAASDGTVTIAAAGGSPVVFAMMLVYWH